MIIGVTHDQDGRVVQRLSVSTKVSIGLPPNGDRNHPTKLDHFVSLRKKKSAHRVEWEADPELTRHYGEHVITYRSAEVPVPETGGFAECLGVTANMVTFVCGRM
jgi:hypothetical protein